MAGSSGAVELCMPTKLSVCTWAQGTRNCHTIWRRLLPNGAGEFSPPAKEHAHVGWPRYGYLASTAQRWRNLSRETFPFSISSRYVAGHRRCRRWGIYKSKTQI